MTEYYKKQFDEKYTEFIKQILKLYPESSSEVNKCVNQISSLNDQEKRECGIKFTELINNSTSNKNNLLGRKIKLFSSKSEENKMISYALLKFIPLKKLLNGNVADNVKEIIWDYIQLLYVFTELSVKDKNNMDKDLIKNLLHMVNDNSKKNSDTSTDNSPSKKKEQREQSQQKDKEKDANILNLDCNPETNNMINDIVGHFYQIGPINTNV